jgi:diguanylate cyclase (GGDEF)-like protein/PAS domain S-box-containing protein
MVLLTGMHAVLQNALTDARFGWFPRQASGNIVLIAIDSPSIEKMGVWPWPRQYHADLIRKLAAAGVEDIVFDVDFSSPSNPASDQAFAGSLQEAGGSVVLPAFKQLVNGASGKTIHVNRPLPQFDKYAWSAIVNVAVESDGLVRRYSFAEPLDGQLLPSLGALLAGKQEIKEELLRIDFSIRAESLPMVSYVDILRGDPAAIEKVKGKKVIIGATAIELGDRFSAPNGQVISGPQLQTLAAESILQGRVLQTTSNFITYGGLGLIALLMAMLWRRHSGSLRVIVPVGLALAAELGAMLLQAKYAIILDTALWHVAIAAYLAAMALDEIDFRSLLGGIAERRFQRIAMSLGDGLVCADRNGLITVWNPGAQAIFGYSSAEMIGQPLETICSVGDKSENSASLSVLELNLGAPQESRGKVMEFESQRKNGERFPLEACFSKWEGVDGFQYGAVMRDISDRKREAERIRYLAEHDTLTGLANRHTLYEHLNAQLAAAKAEQCKVALLVLDLDKFKQVNDTQGHACGDQLLCAVAQRLSTLVEGTGLVARLSGDEFAVVISGADAADRARKLSERISLVFRKMAYFIGDRDFRINASIGVAIFPEYGVTADELFGNADLALYRAKATGRGRHVFFERAIRDELEARLSLEAELARAVERNELELFYQPQVSLNDGELVGVEALIRWRHPHRGLVSPADFMPIVNASSISGRIALWVLETACRQGRLWQQQGHDIRLGVNLSPSQIQAGDLATTIARVLKETAFSPTLLELEVTENILLEDDDTASETFRRIQELGVHIAFDDFGTGYASLTYLKKFSLDGLKIDQSFVRELRADSDDAAIVGCTISLGKLLGLRVIAEGIESAATADLLKRMGCEEGQGYYFSPPVPAAEFEHRFLMNNTVHSAGHSMKESAATAA